LALNLPTSAGRPVGIVRSRIKATEFSSAHYLFNDAFNSLYYGTLSCNDRMVCE
jgi:hypothetical protein